MERAERITKLAAETNRLDELTSGLYLDNALKYETYDNQVRLVAEKLTGLYLENDWLRENGKIPGGFNDLLMWLSHRSNPKKGLIGYSLRLMK